MAYEFPEHNSPDKLHEYLCGLDYYKDINSEEIKETINLNAEFDNSTGILKTDLKEDNHLCKIPNTFLDLKDYLKIWGNLFLLEARAQIGRSEKTEGFEAEMYELSGFEKFQNTYYLDFVADENIKIKYFFNDLVFITREIGKEKTDNCIGVVRSADRTLKVKIYLDENNPNKIFTGKSKKFYVKKICNLVTLDREYQALLSLEDINLKNIVLNPGFIYNDLYNYFSIPEKLSEKLNSLYNKSQLKAIKESLKKEGITLIQGPPGTGKTTTVLGTLSVLFNSSNEEKEKLEVIEKTSDPENFMNVENKDYLYNQKNFTKMAPWMDAEKFVNWRDHFEENDIEVDFEYATAKKTDLVVEMRPIKRFSPPPEKILICAPSNAAIDEIVRKILEKGLLDGHGNRIDPFLVRIGPNIDRNLEKVSLDFLVQEEIKARNAQDDSNNIIKFDVLKKAKIVCATLSSAGSQALVQNKQKFDTVVIDEAAQAVELSTLIPLKYMCKRLILIGDPKQLPATIFSKKCESYKYDLSMFERFQKSGYPIHMLKTQYRMNPQISKFISSEFYLSEIQDAPQIEELVGKPSFYDFQTYQPFMFYNVQGNEEFLGSSYWNEKETDAILTIYNDIKKRFPEFDIKKLGIISPYSKQVEMIRKKIANFEGATFCPVEVNTVDGFQGREKDFIIFSTVRAPEKGMKEELEKDTEKEKEGAGESANKEKEKVLEPLKKSKPTIGFLQDERRMNVSLSRARLVLIVVGNMSRLRISNKWRALMKYAIEKNNAYNLVEPFDLSKVEGNKDRYRIKYLNKRKKEKTEEKPKAPSEKTEKKV